MAIFLTRFTYTPETWARLRERPAERTAAGQDSIQTIGGRLHGFWYALGECDWVVL